MSTNAAAFAADNPRSTALHVSLWVAQIALFIPFIMVGVMKLTTTIPQLVLPEALVRFIGITEVLGAIGLLLPAITRVKPWLTPLAAFGLSVTMVLAIGFHIMRGEFSAILAPLVLGAVATFIAWGRFFRAPITPRA